MCRVCSHFANAQTIIAAAKKLRIEPDLLMVDGQGIAHPRRLGIAAHLGVLFDKPTIGCAKSRLIGKHADPELHAGCHTDLWDHDELIGAVLRTRDNVRPLYISIGHKIDLPTSIKLVLACCRGYRLPEPTRFAHQVAGGKVPSLAGAKLNEHQREEIVDCMRHDRRDQVVVGQCKPAKVNTDYRRRDEIRRCQRMSQAK